jgi:hypothetical protein
LNEQIEGYIGVDGGLELEPGMGLEVETTKNMKTITPFKQKLAKSEVADFNRTEYKQKSGDFMGY